MAAALRNIGGAIAGAAVIGAAATTAGTAVALTAALTSPHVAAAVAVAEAPRVRLSDKAGAVQDGLQDSRQATATGSVTTGSADIAAIGSGRRIRTTPDRSLGQVAEAGTKPKAEERTGSGTARSGDRRSAAPRPAAAIVTAETAQQTEPEFRRPDRQVTADDVIRFAGEQVGVRENAARSTKYQEWYAASPRALETARRNNGRITDYLNAPWCDIFVSWLGEQTGTARSVGSDAYTVEHAGWFQAEGRWGYLPRAGSLAFFAWETDPLLRDVAHIDHVGLVVKDNGDGTIETIEGNTRDAVERKIRPVTSVVGFGYPDFAD